jgi:hypothetical protein
MPNPKAEGSSKSLNKTIAEIDTALAGLALGPTNSPLRRKLRSRISHLVREGFRRGFRRDCIESNKPQSKSKKRISYDAHRDFCSNTSLIFCLLLRRGWGHTSLQEGSVLSAGTRATFRHGTAFPPTRVAADRAQSREFVRGAQFGHWHPGHCCQSHQLYLR